MFPGPRAGHPNPRARVLVLCTVTIPIELDFDPAVFVRVNLLTRRTGDDCPVRLRRGFGRFPRRTIICICAGRDHLKLVAVIKRRHAVRQSAKGAVADSRYQIVGQTRPGRIIQCKDASGAQVRRVAGAEGGVTLHHLAFRSRCCLGLGISLLRVSRGVVHFTPPLGAGFLFHQELTGAGLRVIIAPGDGKRFH